MATDIQEEITARILQELRDGVRPWTRPWDSGGAVSRPRRHNGEPYSGVNVLVLWHVAAEQGYDAATWMTYRQAKELGGFVRKGERSTKVVYANMVERLEKDLDTGEEQWRRFPIWRAYSVFNVEQISDLAEQYYLVPGEEQNAAARIARAERFFAATEADIRHGGDRAFYDAKRDFIRMPPFGTFRDAASYYAALAHETTHWTGHPTRLDRDLGWRFGAASYAMEELVAELGAAFVSADIGLVPPTRRAASYIAEWIQVLENDPRAIFTAATRASQAADYLARITESMSRTEIKGRAETRDREEQHAAQTGGADDPGADGRWVIPLTGGAHGDGAWGIDSVDGLVEQEPGGGRALCFRTRAQADAAAARLDPAWRPRVKRVIAGATQMTYTRTAGGDIVRGDELCWTEQVWTGPWQTPELAGERTIEARVDSAVIVGERSDDRLGLTVSAASGDDAPEAGSLISRRAGELAEAGVWRKKWADETKRDNRRAMDELVRQQSCRQGRARRRSAGIGS